MYDNVIQQDINAHEAENGRLYFEGFKLFCTHAW